MESWLLLISLFCLFATNECSTLKFWQITDQHYDWDYKHQSEPILGSCRFFEGEAGYFGDFNCDIPWRTVESAVKEMAKIAPDVDFIINSGDSFPHAYGNAADKLHTIKNINDLIRQYFPNVPIFYSPGNHDFEPNHSCKPGPNFWLTEMSKIIFDLLNPDQMKTFLKGGYYSQVISGLRIVIMNTVLYYPDNKYTKKLSGDISNQFQWISSELDSAYANNEMVLLVGHVPPGFSERFDEIDFHKHFNEPFLRTLEEHPHKDLIIAQVYGHLHSDSFRLSNNVGALLLSPSLSGWKNYHSSLGVPNNPGMARLFYYDTKEKTLKKYKQYYTDLATSNKNMNLKWQLLYDTSKEPFYMQDLTLQSFQNLYYQIENNDKIFEQYYLFNTVNYKTDECDSECKNMQLCAIKHLHVNEYEFCRKKVNNHRRKFWQITDQHYDWDYKYQSEPILGRCRDGNGEAGYFGDYNCDITWETVESAVKEMAKIAPDVDFIIDSGDSVPHVKLTATDKLQAIKNFHDLIRKYFPNVPIFYSPGNHDFEPNHSCQPGPNFWLTEMSKIIFDLLNPDQMKTFLKGGYYSQVISGLRIVIMNTVLYYHNNKYTTKISGDISNQFQWISSELDSAYANNEMVLLVGHVPPGFSERFGEINFHKHFNEPFLRTLEEHPHKDLIIAQVYGHLHSDSFRLSNNVGALLLSPSLSGWKNYHSPLGVPNNPGMARLFYYDTKEKTLKKYKQYYTDLATSNKNMNLKWQLLYDTSKEPFYMQDLTLQSLQNLYYQIENNDKIFEQYYLFNTVNYKTDECDSECKNMQLCAIKHLYEHEFETCRY
ncbi:sphingomyelin phosphodiesterase [Anaeramoeba flamelloides]|uniref:Sphingomyelin phosphodiesterase n=1 Tax=Anaeramoeba flamelloides TaxID=1746091 RepID=A0ABQ8XZ00_9EUKA|nr:sphingomyelin phosphodiesterase [Anaeramoeba flamelloides]